MSTLFSRTLGGLTPAYYFRNLFFGSLFCVVAFYAFWNTGVNQPGHFKAATVLTVLYGITTLLYPYSRYAYERAVGFVIGENIFGMPTVFYLLAKLLTMFVCWGLALFIAPVGLLILYFTNHQRGKGDTI